MKNFVIEESSGLWGGEGASVGSVRGEDSTRIFLSSPGMIYMSSSETHLDRNMPSKTKKALVRPRKQPDQPLAKSHHANRWFRSEKQSLPKTCEPHGGTTIRSPYLTPCYSRLPGECTTT